MVASQTLLLLLIPVALQIISADSEQKNVLLMFIDDGGLEMGVYGNKAVQTPNIDNFAKKKAVVFKHGYTSVSSCSPSRSALLTGMLYSYKVDWCNSDKGVTQDVTVYST